MGLNPIKTVLNSGNILFEAGNESTETLEKSIEVRLEKSFGFFIHVLITTLVNIQDIIATNPFKDIAVHKDIRLYVTFTKKTITAAVDLPRVSDDGYFQIIGTGEKVVYSVLDVSKAKTTNAMEMLEKIYGKDITTRNWNTLLKIA